MDFDDTDQDKDKTAADRFDPEGGSEPVSDMGQMSIDEKLRRFANEQWVQQLANDMQEDADGKDATNLSDSLGHFIHGAAATGAMTSDMYSAFKAQMYRAIERNEREEKQQVQINLVEDREEKKRKAEEDAEEEFEGSVDRVKAEEKREREREAWAQSTHRFGNVELTGEEWGQLADKLKSDTALRNWLLAKMKKDGMTDAQALTMLDKVALATEMQSMPKSDWTPEMKALDQEMKDNPELGETIKGYTDAAHNAERSGQHLKADAGSFDAGRAVSVESRSDKLEAASGEADASKAAALNRAVAEAQKSPTTDQPLKDGAKSASGVDAKQFPTAPDLGAHYDKALVATEPLDGAKELKIAANDVKPQPAPTGMGGLEG